MFVRHVDAPAERVTVLVDGHECRVPGAISVAAALLLEGHAATGRTPVTGRPRGPWCLMGTCFGCLVEIDGVADVRACVTTVEEGMSIVLGAAPRGGSEIRDADPWGDAP